MSTSIGRMYGTMRWKKIRRNISSKWLPTNSLHVMVPKAYVNEGAHARAHARARGSVRANGLSARGNGRVVHNILRDVVNCQGKLCGGASGLRCCGGGCLRFLLKKIYIISHITHHTTHSFFFLRITTFFFLGATLASPLSLTTASVSRTPSSAVNSLSHMSETLVLIASLY